MIISPQSLDTNLSQLLAEVKSGSMQLPEFQRDWTWDDNRIRGIIMWLLAQDCENFDQLQQRFYRQINFDTFYH